MNKIVPIAGLAGIMLVLAFAGSLVSVENQALAQTTTPFPSREKVISVTGVATASVDPDLLVITFGIETQEKTAKEAFASNSESMNAIVSAVKSLGISDDELSTSQLNIYPVYESYRDSNDRYRQELVGYRVTNTLSVETSQLDSAADIIDGAVSAGANRVDSVYFTLAPETQLQIKDDLLEQAVINAKTKAENALSPLDHKIIGVKAISLSEFGMPSPMPIYADFAMAESADMGFAKSASAPIFSSEQDVRTTATVVFLIGSN